MNKIAPIVIIITLLLTLIPETEGTPTPQANFQIDVDNTTTSEEISFSQGWSMFCLPLLFNEYQNPSDWDNITGFESLCRWNTDIQEYEMYVKGVGFTTSVFNLEWYEGYWAFFSINQTIFINGSYLFEYLLELNEGWNLIPHHLPTISASVIASQVTAGGLDSIATWNTLTSQFEYYIFPTDQMDLYTSKSYFVWSDTPTIIHMGGT